MLIDPNDVTYFDRTTAELEAFLLMGLAVAGKTAFIQVEKLNEFLIELDGGTPFEKIRNLESVEELEKELRRVKLGKYNILKRGYWEVAHAGFDLRKVSIQELEGITGIGRKTSRYFVLHSRENAGVACLDTHILKWLDELGYENVPKSTPTSKGTYERLEKAFLKECEIMDTHPADVDLVVWQMYSRG